MFYEYIGVSKRTDTKEGTKFRVIMEHEEFYFFAFGISLTRKSFWKLQLRTRNFRRQIYVNSKNVNVSHALLSL
jgi:hypothetical protein